MSDDPSVPTVPASTTDIVSDATNLELIGVKGGSFSRTVAGQPGGPAVIDPVSGGINADVTFLQNGVGAVKRLSTPKLADHYNVFDLFSAAQYLDAVTGAATIDTTSLIQQAIDNAVALGQRCVAYGTFRVSSKIVFKGEADFRQARFLVYGTPAIAIEVSTGSAANPADLLRDVEVRLPKYVENMTKPGTGWAGQGVGIRTVNLNACTVYIGRVKNFATGVLATAYAGGNAYNTFHVSMLDNNQVGWDFAPDATGWVNENLIIGGRFAFNSGEGTAVSGTRHIRFSKAANGVNNNVFDKPSLEGDVPEYHVENGGSYNTIRNARWEATTPSVLYTADNSNQATRNLIIGGYQTERIVFTLTGTSGFINSVINAQGSIYNGSQQYGNLKFRNTASSGEAIFAFFASNVPPSTANGSNYSVQYSANLIAGKATADAYDRIQLSWSNSRLYFGNGTVAPTAYIASRGTAGISANSDWTPVGTGTFDLGLTGNRWKQCWLSAGFGAWGVDPPASKPALTGSLSGATATVVGQIAALLASYGLATNSTTA